MLLSQLQVFTIHGRQLLFDLVASVAKVGKKKSFKVFWFCLREVKVVTFQSSTWERDKSWVGVSVEVLFLLTYICLQVGPGVEGHFWKLVNLVHVHINHSAFIAHRGCRYWIAGLGAHHLSVCVIDMVLPEITFVWLQKFQSNCCALVPILQVSQLLILHVTSSFKTVFFFL